ncbi:MAG: hypothetical protein P8Y46_04370 [Sulfurovaceae bacterium]
MSDKYFELTISAPAELLEFIADLVSTLTHDAIEMKQLSKCILILVLIA